MSFDTDGAHRQSNVAHGGSCTFMSEIEVASVRRPYISGEINTRVSCSRRSIVS